MQQLSRQGKKADITSQGMWNYINWDCSVEMSDQCYAMIQKATKSTSHKSLGNKLRKENTIMLKYGSLGIHINNCLWFWSLSLKKCINV